MRYLFLLLFTSFLFAVGCSDNKVEKPVWQEKIDTIDKAKEVEQLLKDTVEQQKQYIDEKTR
jgi:hypothetical protein